MTLNVFRFLGRISKTTWSVIFLNWTRAALIRACKTLWSAREIASVALSAERERRTVTDVQPKITEINSLSDFNRRPD